jgi:excisionase family DNA binding protein
MDRLINAEEAARLLSVSPSTIRFWWSPASGKLQRVKIGRLSRVRESELLSLINPALKGRDA